MKLKSLTFLAVAILIALTLIFFWKILLTNLILSGTDVFLYFYPYKVYAAETLRQGRIPLWNPHLFMGVPLLANSQVGIFYPLNWPFIWLDAPRQVAWSIGLHITLAGLFTFHFAQKSLRLSWAAALLAALVFALGGYLGAQVEHINQLQAAAWLPLLFLLYDLGQQSSQKSVVSSQKVTTDDGRRTMGGKNSASSEQLAAVSSQASVISSSYLDNSKFLTPNPKSRIPKLGWLLFLAVVIGLTLLAGHVQTVFISLFGLGLYALWQAVFEPTSPYIERYEVTKSSPEKFTFVWRHIIWRPLVFIQSLLQHLWPIALAAIIAVALAAIQLLPTTELSSLSIRQGGLTFQEVVSFSLRPTNLHYSLLPPINIDLSQVMGQAFSEWVAYLGITGLMLAGLGALTASYLPPARRFIFLSVSGLILSFGLFTGPLYLVLYKLIPGFSLFRVPARWLLLYAFGMAILVGFGFDSLLQPPQLSQHLNKISTWFKSKRRIGLLFIPLLACIALILWKTPPPSTLVIWLTLTLLNIALIYRITHHVSSVKCQVKNRDARHLTPDTQHPTPHVPRVKYQVKNRKTRHPTPDTRPAPRPTSHVPRPTLLLIPLLLTLELFWAAQPLNYNQPTAPQAYHSMRNAVAFLLATDPPDKSTPPDRFLSLSGTAYDPGDLADLTNIFADSLSEKALYDLVVATKEKEVLFFNLPLIYGLHSVDGYDGGILPLAQFVTLQQLFLPVDNLSQDGRLREKLQFVPPGRLLSLLNTRWIITDKVFDVWIEGIFYDLQFPARLEPKQIISTDQVPEFSATALGLVSHLENGLNLPQGNPVAEIALTFVDGTQEVITLQAGVDTAEGGYPADNNVQHNQAPIGVTWPYEGDGVDYISLTPLPTLAPLTNIAIKATLPEGQFVLRGISLIHQPTTTSRSILLSTEGRYKQVHSGDVKVYENIEVLPRAYVVHQTQVVTDDSQAIAVLKDIQFDPTRTMVRVDSTQKMAQEFTLGQPSPQDNVTITSYSPERVELLVHLDSPGWLVLTDTFYPGWQATVDGQPVEIHPVNILFRAIEAPEGEHTIVFEYQPASFYWGLMISGVMLLVMVIAGGILWRRRD